MWGHGLHLRLKSSSRAFMVFYCDDLFGGGGKDTSLFLRQLTEQLEVVVNNSKGLNRNLFFKSNYYGGCSLPHSK